MFQNAPMDNEGKPIVWARFELDGETRYGRVLVEDSNEQVLTVRVAISREINIETMDRTAVYTNFLSTSDEVVRVPANEVYLFFGKPPR